MYRLKTYATYGLNERNVSCCMFPIYNNVTRGFLIICVCVCVCVCVHVSLSFCFCCCYFFSFFFSFFHFPITYLSLVITSLLTLLQLCSLILQFWVFLRNQVGESSKQEIQAAWSTPIHNVK